MDAKEERRIEDRLVKTREELTSFIFWLFSQHEREKVMNELKLIQSHTNYHRWSTEATDLLKIIEAHIEEVVAFKLYSRVVLLSKQNNILAGSAGEVILTTSTVAEVKFDCDPKPMTLNKYLFRLETQENNGTETVSASGESGKDLDEGETNPLHAGVGGGDDGTVFLAQQEAQKKRDEVPDEPKEKEKMDQPVGSKGTKKSKKTAALSAESDAKINGRILQHLEHWMTLLVNGTYWLLSGVKQEKIIDQLNQIKMGGNQEFKETATMLLSDIQKRLAIAETLQTNQRVSLHITVDEKPAGTIGTVMSIINAKAHVRFGDDKKMTVISKFLLDPALRLPPQESVKDVEIQDASSDVTETPSSIEDVVLPPTPDSETFPAPIESDFVVAMMVVSPQPAEERFQIKNPAAFEYGFPFARQRVEDDQPRLFVALRVDNNPVERHVHIVCLEFGQPNCLSTEYQMTFLYPKLLFSSKPEYFYLTPHEWQQFYELYPFGFSEGFALWQINDYEQTYRKLLLRDIQLFLQRKKGWTDDLNNLNLMAQFVRAHIDEKRLVQLIVEGIGADISYEDLTDLRFDHFLIYFDNDPLFASVYELVRDVRQQTKKRVHLATVKKRIRNYTQILENGLDDDFSDDQLAHIAVIMENVTERKEKKE